MKPRILRKTRCHWPATVVACVALTAGFGSGGCTSAAGTVFAISDSAISGSGAIYWQGKVEFATSATFDQSHAAILAALKDLGMQELKSQTRTKQTTETYHLVKVSEKETLDLLVTRHTPSLCVVRIDVGWFGSVPIAKVLAERIHQRLPASVSMSAPKA